jgi:hypothetical protein
MKTQVKILILTVLFALTSCSEDANNSANSTAGFSASDINGTWKVSPSNLTIYISGASETNFGTATITSVGTAMPSGANGGQVLQEIEHIQGGYWNAYNYTYYTNGTWAQTSVVGLAMSDDKSQFKIGSAVYKRQ